MNDVSYNTIAGVEDSSSNDQILESQFRMEDEDEEEVDTVTGAVDYKHNPAVRSETGRWRSAAFIIGVEMAERIAHFGISSNLINFMTLKLGQSTAMAAANVNAWNGASYLLPLVGAVIADSFLGKYYTVVAASLFYILGLGLLTVSAMLPSPSCLNNDRIIEAGGSECVQHFQITLSFAALYLVGLGQGGHKPCVQAFGGDQFDEKDPAESKGKSSFFNWWYFGLWMGAILGIAVLSYVQDNLSWGLGFGIPCIIMVFALMVFLLGTSSYRYIETSEGRSPLYRIGRVFVRAVRNSNALHFVLGGNVEAQGIRTDHSSEEFRFLDKALLEPNTLKVAAAAPCSKSEVEEAKAILSLFPIWATSLAFAIVFSQTSTFFTKQGVTLDRHIGSSFVIPAAALQSFMGICVVIFIPIYDRVLVPMARKFTGKPAGISVLQRIGTGFFIAIVCMIVAAVTEKRRLQTALQYGLVDLPDVTLPMSIWWLLPQYATFSIAEAFAIVGLQELFYDQVPTGLRSVGLSLYLSIFGTGNLLSSILVYTINKATSGGATGSSWFSDNLNRGHLDYFYWLLAALTAVGLALFMHFARSYKYKNKVPI